MPDDALVSHKSATSSINYRPDIDGLRALAILAVIGFHYKVYGFSGGFIGVDIFLVISGFLIGSIIYREQQQGKFSIARFYERRFRRILPALLAVIAFTLAVAFFIFSPYEMQRLAESAFAASLSLSNFLFIVRTDYFAGGAQSNPLLMTWSLAVEEQFYLFFPFLMLLLSRSKKGTILWILGSLVCLSLAFSIYAEFFLQRINFYFPLTRGWSLGMGVFLAVWLDNRNNAEKMPAWQREVLGLLGFLSISLCVWIYNEHTHFPGYEAILPVFGAVLILLARDSVINRILGTKLLVFIGLLSYSLYLWHWPLISIASVICPQPLRPETLILLLTLTIVFATASYYLIERPLRTVKLSNRNTLWIYGSSGLLCALISLSIVWQRGLPGRFIEISKMESVGQVNKKHLCLSSSGLISLNPQCVPEPKGDLSAIALLGDSHADAIAGTLRGLTKLHRLTLIQLTHEKCPPTIAWTRLWDVSNESCRRYNRSVLDFIAKRPDIKTVFLTAAWAGPYIPDNMSTMPSTQNLDSYDTNLHRGLEEEVNTLRGLGKNVIIMDDVPQLTFDPMWNARDALIPSRHDLAHLLLARSFMQIEGDNIPRATVFTETSRMASSQIEMVARENKNIVVIDPKSVFCNQKTCSFGNSLDLFYADSSHLNQVGSDQLLPLFNTLRLD